MLEICTTVAYFSEVHRVVEFCWIHLPHMWALTQNKGFLVNILSSLFNSQRKKWKWKKWWPKWSGRESCSSGPLWFWEQVLYSCIEQLQASSIIPIGTVRLDANSCISMKDSAPKRSANVHLLHPTRTSTVSKQNDTRLSCCKKFDCLA